MDANACHGAAAALRQSLETPAVREDEAASGAGGGGGGNKGKGKKRKRVDKDKASVVKSEQALLDEVEFEWLRQVTKDNAVVWSMTPRSHALASPFLASVQAAAAPFPLSTDEPCHTSVSSQTPLLRQVVRAGPVPRRYAPVVGSPHDQAQSVVAAA